MIHPHHPAGSPLPVSLSSPPLSLSNLPAMDKRMELKIDVNGREFLPPNKLQRILFSYTCKLRCLLLGQPEKEMNDNINIPPSSLSLSSTSSLLSLSSPSTSSSSSGEKTLKGFPIWIEDLTSLNPAMAENIINQMISHKVNHPTVAKFLLHYLKSKQSSPKEEKKKTLETVIDFLFFLKNSSTSCKTLFGVYHFSFGLKISRSCRVKLEKMIGERLDEASLDNLLVPGYGGMYDVDLVLRLVRVFVKEKSSPERTKKVVSLVDSYLAEIAPEKNMKREKFLGLLKALPEGASESYDAVYRAVDVFLQVHSGSITEEERERVYAALSSRFPPRAGGDFQMKSILRGEEREQIVLYARKMGVFSVEEAEKMRARIRGMQWKMTAVHGRRTLPRLCS